MFEWGLVLEQIRSKNNLKITEMARLMGITRQSYYKRLKGAELKWDEMANLKLKLNIDLNSLVFAESKYDELPVQKREHGLENLFKDYINYDIHPDEVRKLILHKIFVKFFSKKSFYEKLVQNNRAIADFATILLSIDKSRISNKKTKESLINCVKNAKIKTSEKRVKKNIIDKLSLLSEKDCYYIFNFSKLAAEILLEFVPKKDYSTLKILGYGTLLKNLNL